MKTILLKFSGPLQSWGTNSHFEIRRTDDHPSKSGVIGMIAAGLGYKRDETEKICRLNDLHFAVRVDQPGYILKDYHIVKRDKRDKKPYVTERYYLQDAVFIVALGSEDGILIEDIKKSILRPYYHIFLGRKALPPTADLFIDIVEVDPIIALKKLVWNAAPWYQKKYEKSDKKTVKLSIFADKTLVDRRNGYVRNDVVKSFSNETGRKFDARLEVMIKVDIFKKFNTGENLDNCVLEELVEEHDVFEAIGEC